MRKDIWSDASAGAIRPQPERSLRSWSAVVMWVAGGYGGSSHFIARVTLLVLAFWAAGIVINVFRGRMLAAELRSSSRSPKDPLTGLANLRSFRDSVLRALETWKQAGLEQRLEPAVVLIDLDDFKTANTRLGHNGGDSVLFCAGSSLYDVVAPDDLVARVGGDEFAVLTYGRPGSELVAFAASCGDAIRTAGRTGSIGHSVTASIGAASAAVAGTSLDALIGGADNALFEAKASGKDCSVVATAKCDFTPLDEPFDLRLEPQELPTDNVAENAQPRLRAAIWIAGWLGGAVAVAILASPFLYESSADSSEYVLKFTVLLSTALVLAGLLTYSRRALVAEERRARLLLRSDPLTGLANRREFMDQMLRQLADRTVIGLHRSAGSSQASGLAVVIVDLDNFKRANSAHGHAGGDLVLRSVAAALRSVVREGDLVARIGGDEFAVIAPGAREDAARELAQSCVAAARDGARRLGLVDCDVSASAGFSVLGVHGNTYSELMKAADQAMMSVKTSGKGAAAEARLG